MRPSPRLKEAEAPSERDPDRSLSGIRVLVVDDHEDSRDFVRRVLEEREAEVITAASAAHAFELIRTAPPDVLVSDLGMPDEDGFELVRRVRALGEEQGGALPAAALSAFTRTEDQERALEAGYQAHLSKPVDPAALIAAVARLASL